MKRMKWLGAGALVVLATSVYAGGFLGVATTPVNPALAEHLELPGNAGLQIVHVAEGGPSAGVLNVNDILYKLDGQILINHEQLAALVRHHHQAGDKVKCELVRKGQRVVETVKLGEAPEAPPIGMRGPFWSEEEPGWHKGARNLREKWNELPEELESAQKHLEDLIKELQGSRLFTTPQGWIHDWGQRADGEEPSVTVKQSSRSEVRVSEDGLTLKFVNENGDKHLIVSRGDKEIFNGPINTDEERSRIPEDVRDKVQEIESRVKVDVRVRETPGDVEIHLDRDAGI